MIVFRRKRKPVAAFPDLSMSDPMGNPHIDVDGKPVVLVMKDEYRVSGIAEVPNAEQITIRSISDPTRSTTVSVRNIDTIHKWL